MVKHSEGVVIQKSVELPKSFGNKLLKPYGKSERKAKAKVNSILLTIGKRLAVEAAKVRDNGKGKRITEAHVYAAAKTLFNNII